MLEQPRQGNSRAYLLTRLEKKDKTLYADVVAGNLSAHAAARQVGIIKTKTKTPLEQLEDWWMKASVEERQIFLQRHSS